MRDSNYAKLVAALKQIRFVAWEVPSDKRMQEVYEIADHALQSAELPIIGNRWRGANVDRD